ncbi:MAG: ArsA family ATPase [Acidobacteriota bacterium]
MRVLLFAGKGGVGKTTLAAATAVHAAARGRSTLLLSTDAAHSLSDVWGKSLGAEPARLADNLCAAELSATHEIEESWGIIRDFVARLLASQGVDDGIADELAILPGAEELCYLLAIERCVRQGVADSFESLVIDCAPTASTVRLLAMPQALTGLVRRLFPTTRRLMSVLRPIAERALSVPIPPDPVLDRCEQILVTLDRLRRRLEDPDVTSVRLVTQAETVVLSETRRLHAVLHLFGLPVDLVVCNRVLDPAHAGADGWRAAQARCLATMEEAFTPTPLRRVTFVPARATGKASLARLGRELYDGVDPLAVLHRDRPMKVIRRGRDSLLALDLPLPSARDLTLSTTGHELCVQIGGFRRSIVLPRGLRDRSITDATLEDGRLEVRFAAPAARKGA